MSADYAELEARLRKQAAEIQPELLSIYEEFAICLDAANALADLRKQRDEWRMHSATSLEAQLAEAQRLLELLAGELYTVQNERERIEADLAEARAAFRSV